MVSGACLERFTPDNLLNLQFVAHKYGPFANRLDHLLNNLDGSYLHCEKRISDAGPLDVIWFDDEHKAFLETYLKSEAKSYAQALDHTAALIDGFESPFGMDLLATVDWLLNKEGVPATVQDVRESLQHWPTGAAACKSRLFDERAIGIALERLVTQDRQVAMA